MKTISFRFKTDEKLREVISEDSRICSAMRRYAFNRIREGITSGVELNKLLKERFECNSILRASAHRNAKTLSKLEAKDKKVYFGKFKRFSRGLITKEEYKKSRNTGIFCEGEANEKGNRLFKIDLENGRIVYKRACKEHYDLVFDQKISEGRKQILKSLQLLMEEKKTPVTVRVKENMVYLTYDETVVEKEKRFRNLFGNRVLGIDLNPNFFGISIVEFDKDDNFRILYKEVVDVERLQKQPKNKIRFELQQIDRHILRLCKCWHCGKIAVEDLKFKKNNKFWSRSLNRLCRNQFRFSLVKTHLQTLCSVHGVELVEVNAAYSSIIGNFVHGSSACPDMVAASVEIARRSYHKFRKGWYQPSFVTKERVRQVLGNQWKEEPGSGHMTWKMLAGKIKESGFRYRFPLDPSNAVLRKFHKRSYTMVYEF